MNWIFSASGTLNKCNFILVAGNKCDLHTERVVKGTEAALFAARNNMMYMETSSVENTNVEMAYITLVSIIIREHKLKCAKNQNMNEKV